MESVTLLRRHKPRERFAVVRCGDCWELRLLVDSFTVRRESIPARFAESLVEAATRDTCQIDRQL
jgi:hypothetical protein